MTLCGPWTKESLLRLPFSELATVGAGFGVSPRETESVLVYEILIRQGERCGRSHVPTEVRLLNLEDGQNRMQEVLVRLGRIVAELGLSLLEKGAAEGTDALLRDLDYFRRLARLRPRG